MNTQNILSHQEMAMRKVTRTLFHDDDNDDMVSSSSVQSLPVAFPQLSSSGKYPILCAPPLFSPRRELTARVAESTTSGAAR